MTIFEILVVIGLFAIIGGIYQLTKGVDGLSAQLNQIRNDLGGRG